MMASFEIAENEFKKRHFLITYLLGYNYILRGLGEKNLIN